jgi:hypothetical protein
MLEVEPETQGGDRGVSRCALSMFHLRGPITGISHSVEPKRRGPDE